jgi:hypothetical protein
LPAARHRWRGGGGGAARGDRRRRGRTARRQQPESGVGDSGEVGALGGPPARTGGGAGPRRGKSSQRRLVEVGGPPTRGDRGRYRRAAQGSLPGSCLGVMGRPPSRVALGRSRRAARRLTSVPLSCQLSGQVIERRENLGYRWFVYGYNRLRGGLYLKIIIVRRPYKKLNGKKTSRIEIAPFLELFQSQIQYSIDHG